MTLTASKSINNRPQFQNHTFNATKPLLLENRNIAALIPSQQNQNKIFIYIHSVFQKLIHWLYPFEKTNYTGIVAAFDRTSEQGSAQIASLDKNHLLAYFKRFFSADGSSSTEINSCIQQLQEQYKAVENLNKFAEEKNERNKNYVKLQAPLKKWRAEINALKPGKQQLILGSDSRGNEIFYLFSRNAQGIDLKIIGRGEAMVVLSGVREAAIAGKVKIPATLSFRQITPQQIETLLMNYSPLGKEMNLGELQTFLASMAGQRVQDNLLNDLASATSSPKKVFQTLFKQINLNAGKQNGDFSRVKLRAKLFTLFSLLKQVQRNFSRDPEEIQTLERMVRICGQDLISAHQKGIITQTELDQMSKELAIVKKGVDVFQTQIKPVDTACKVPGMGRYTLNPFQLTAPSIVAKPSVIAPSALRAPAPLPADAGVQVQMQPPAVRLPLNALHGLSAASSKEQILHAIFAVEFSPEENAPWRALSQNEARVYLEKLNTLSRRLAEESKHPNHLSVDSYMALVRMSLMVAHLNHFVLNGGVFTADSYYYLHDLHSLTHQHAYYYRARNLAGYSLHSENAVAHAETDRLTAVLTDSRNSVHHQFTSIPKTHGAALPYLKTQYQLLNEALSFPLLHTDTNRANDLLSFYSGSIRSSTCGWVPSLSLSLLAVYYNLSLGDSTPLHSRTYSRRATANSVTQIWSHGENHLEHRNTQEAIVDDPRSTIRAYTDYLMNMEIQPFRTYAEGPANDSINQNRESKTLNPEATRMREGLLRQAEFLLRASQKEHNFSEEELTALLLLMRREMPQTELTAFMQTHPRMLSNPQVRSFVQLLFFGPSLLEFLPHPGYRRHNQVAENLVRFFSNKIQEYRQRVVQEPREMPQFLFFLSMSERLQGIHTALGYDTAAFFDLATVEADLAQIRLRTPLHPLPAELIALQLKIALKKPHLTQSEISQILIDRMLLKNSAAIPPSDELEIETRYQQMIGAIGQAQPPVLTPGHYHHILDQICAQKQLPLDGSAWVANGTSFENQQYAIDLTQGTLRNKLSGAVNTTLPDKVIHDPFFAKCYPGLTNLESLQVFMQTKADGARTYLFSDAQGNSSQIEEKNGVYTYYKSLPGTGQLLQATQLAPQNSADPLASLIKPESQGSQGISGLLEILKKLKATQSREPVLPALLKQPVLIDPKAPQKGFIADSSGKLAFEIEFETVRGAKKIKNLFDLRSGKKSDPKVLSGTEGIDHPLLKQLEQFESAEHILLWGKKGTGIQGRLFSSSVETIEFSRYGLSFSLQNGRFVCNQPQYAGYSLSLNASVKQRNSIPFSLLLEHPDRSKPSKLLIPPASAISQGAAPPKTPSGIAYIIWVIKTAIDLFIRKSITSLAPSLHLHIDPKQDKLDLISIDLNPHTRELQYEPGKEIEHSQELISQLLTCGKYEQAFEVLHAAKMEKSELEARKWISFARKLHHEPMSASISLKVLDRVYRTIDDGQNSYKEMRKQVRILQADAFKNYLRHGKKLPASLRLSRQEIERLSALVRKNDANYYQKHLVPLLQPLGQHSPLPTTFTDGRETPLPPLAELAARDPNRPRPNPILALEAQLHPEQPITIESLSHPLPLLPTPIPLLFEQSYLGRFFNAQRVLPAAQVAPLNQMLIAKERELKAQQESAKIALETLLSTSNNSQDQVAIIAGEKRIASSTELMLALYQNELRSLQEILPMGIDLEKLKQALILYYDLDVKLHLALRGRSELARMIQEQKQLTPAEWNLRSSNLCELLSYRRQYRVEQHPDLLMFEAFNFMTFRDAVQPSQLELLRALLENPQGIVQAGTGSGKSSVLSILRALKKADGRNLVTYKVLPQLYAETLSLMQGRLEKTFKRKLFAFRFDLKTPMQDRNGNSIFIEIYQKMLETVQNKGCILTDYKSFPLLEEKFWSLNRELASRQADGIPFDPIQTTHWEYLRKILVLQQNREDQLMDEFDEPSRPVHRIQMQITPGAAAPNFMIEESLALYDRLVAQAPLRLADNLQGDLPAQVRQECIRRVAEEIARERATADVNWEQIFNYFTSVNEDLLPLIENWTPEQKDRITFLKDQFSTFIPLTLNYSGITKYRKSKDGTRIITCVQGEPREAKFGNIPEEINYSIQEYIQHKVALPTVRSYVQESLAEFQNQAQGAEQRFQEVVPGHTLDRLSRLSPQDLENAITRQILPQINQSGESVRFFLRRHLATLRTSGCVSSMNPQDCVAMSLATSGVSASVGALESLHQQFQTNAQDAARIAHEMATRIRRRAVGEPIQYDPANPVEVLRLLNRQQRPLDVIIDGSGAFRECSSRTVAETLLQTNPALKRVEYYDENGTLSYIGDPHAPIAAKGFYFAQAYTRGADQQFKPDAVALLTVNEQGGMEDLSQQEGRMRLNGQKVIYAVSQFAPERMRTVDGIIAHKEENQRAQNAEDRFRAEPQRMRQMLRASSRRELLQTADLNLFLQRFTPWSEHFIQPAGATYEQPGSYYEQHQHITPRNRDPIQELNAMRNHLIQRAAQMGVPHDALQQVQYTEEMRPHFPQQVSPLTATEGQQLEVEEEREEQNEIQQEQQMEEETESVNNMSRAASYLPRNRQANAVFSAHERIHPAFDPRIEFTNNFLPLNRQDPLHRRTPFDSRMFRVGSIKIYIDWTHYHDYPNPGRTEIFRVVIGDSLDAVEYNRVYDVDLAPRNTASIEYDIRTDQVIHNGVIRPTQEFNPAQNQQFQAILAQIKFMDGQIEGYTQEQLDHLTAWFQQNNNLQELRQLFENRILRYRSERNRYRHSQLWNHFQTIARV